MITRLDRLQGRDIYENTALAKINELVDVVNNIQKGDIIVFPNEARPNGHIAIAIDNNITFALILIISSFFVSNDFLFKIDERKDVYGPLDDAYELNHCTGIEAELYITKDAQRKGERPMHGIAISGDVYEVTANLKNALKLYVEFKDQH